MRVSTRIIVSLLSVIFSAATLSAQANPQPEPLPMHVPDASQGDTSVSGQFQTEKAPKDAAQERAERQMDKERQKQRWQEIKRRSEQLLETATELKQYVDKSGESVMSVEVIKKAQQMEKLSKDLQRMMKGD